jgi:hypothetical protein
VPFPDGCAVILAISSRVTDNGAGFILRANGLQDGRVGVRLGGLGGMETETQKVHAALGKVIMESAFMEWLIALLVAAIEGGGPDLRKWLRHKALDLRFFVRACRAPRVKSVASAGRGLGAAASRRGLTACRLPARVPTSDLTTSSHDFRRSGAESKPRICTSRPVSP